MNGTACPMTATAAMTPEQVRLVRESFALVQPLAAPAAADFYQRLFARDPALRALFRGDLAEQGRRLMQMIGGAVAMLDRPAALEATLRQLGARHVGYGVRPDHYASVGAALLDTLAHGLGEAFTPAVRAAWTAMYGHVSRTMQDGAAA